MSLGSKQDGDGGRKPWWRRLFGARRRRGGPEYAIPQSRSTGMPADRRERTGPQPRPIRLLVEGTDLDIAKGIRQRRFIGIPEFDFLDPFLMVEWLRADPGDAKLGAFADQPLLGFEVLTYLVDGRMRHSDSQGFSGTIAAGGAQWLSAAGGVVRQETPEREDGRFSAFRVWFNLPRREKDGSASYPEFGTDMFPVERRLGARLKVIAGMTSEGLTGPILNRTAEATVIDVTLEPGALLEEKLAERHAALIVVHEGEVGIPTDWEGDPPLVKEGELAVIGDGDVLTMVAGAGGARLLLATALPHGEPVSRSGPIAMGSRQELLEAIRNYREGKF